VPGLVLRGAVAFAPQAAGPLPDPPMLGRFLIALIAILPTHLLSRLAGRLASASVPMGLRGAVYRGYSRLFGVNLDEVELPLEAYPSINAFFTRSLRPGLRPLAHGALASPADAAVGAWGTVTQDTLVQAKGRNYSLAALLGDRAMADRMEGGTFTTLYLSPKDYHRLHFPVDGVVTGATYIPGKLWPVNVHAVTHVADLFAVNERLVVTMERPGGAPVSVVLVGATMVGMTRLVFDDLHTNARRREIQHRRYDPPVAAELGAPLGHFEFGSTVIVVCAPDAAVIEPLVVGQTVRVGQRLGSLGAPAR
jgi:phosphatidylserine decarboxylase